MKFDYRDWYDFVERNYNLSLHISEKMRIRDLVYLCGGPDSDDSNIINVLIDQFLCDFSGQSRAVREVLAQKREAVEFMAEIYGGRLNG